MAPAKVLGLVAASFFVPAIYVLSVAFIQKSPSASFSPPSASLVTMCYVLATLALGAPVVFRRWRGAAVPFVSLLSGLISALFAATLGLLIGFLSGELFHVLVLAASADAALIGWAWASRESFRPAHRISIPVRSYTIVLVVVGVLGFAVALFRTVYWELAAGTSVVGGAQNGFLIFIELTLGLSAFGCARLRARRSVYASCTTEVLSWVFLIYPLVKTGAAIYWLTRIRQRERAAATTPDAA